MLIQRTTRLLSQKTQIFKTRPLLEAFDFDGFVEAFDHHLIAKIDFVDDNFGIISVMVAIAVLGLLPDLAVGQFEDCVPVPSFKLSVDSALYGAVLQRADPDHLIHALDLQVIPSPVLIDDNIRAVSVMILVTVGVLLPNPAIGQSEDRVPIPAVELTIDLSLGHMGDLYTPEWFFHTLNDKEVIRSPGPGEDLHPGIPQTYSLTVPARHHVKLIRADFEEIPLLNRPVDGSPQRRFLDQFPVIGGIDAASQKEED